MHSRPISDDLNDVSAAAKWVDEALNGVRLQDTQRFNMHVCLEEALANLIMHGRPCSSAGKQISLGIETARDAVVISIADSCLAFDVSNPEMEGHFASEDHVGGRGLRLIRALASDLNYRSADGRNELRLRFDNDDLPERERDLALLVREIPAFAKMPEAVLISLIKRSARVEFAPGDRMLGQGEASSYALIVLRGEVSIVNESQHGAAPLAQISAPALVGEIGALVGLPRTAGVVAKTHIAALQAPGSLLLAAARQTPELLLSVIQQLGRQTHTINAALGLYAAGFAALEADDFDPQLLEDLQHPTPALIDFSHAFQKLAQRVTNERRSRDEMASAAAIQRAMLPPPLDQAMVRGRCDAFGDIKAARAVGGDLFDLFVIDDKRLALVVGDVCGKGVPASLFMSVTVTALRVAAKLGDEAADIVASANDTICDQNGADMFATLFYGVLDLETRELSYVNCGHNPPYVMRRGGACEELIGRGPPVGLFPDTAWKKHVLQLESGDGLFIYSDGVTEGENLAGESYGDARLTELLSARGDLGAEALVKFVLADIDVFVDGAEQFDDITCLAALLP